jgi:hypothetical protein
MAKLPATTWESKASGALQGKDALRFTMPMPRNTRQGAVPVCTAVGVQARRVAAKMETLGLETGRPTPSKSVDGCVLSSEGLLNNETSE